MKSILCFLITNFIQLSLQVKLYNFDPESRHLVVNDGDNYFVSFLQITNITRFAHCYITSDTISTDYPLLEKLTQDISDDGSSGFSPREGIECGFSYKEVNDKVPRRWILTAYDNITRRNYTEEVTITFYYNMPLYLLRWEGFETSSAVNFYQSGNTQLKKCALTFDNTSIDLNLDEIQVYEEDNLFKSRLYSLGGGKCGYKINHLSLGDSRDLTLFATDNDNKMYRNTSQLVVTKPHNLINRTIEVYLGSTATVACGQIGTSAETSQLYCHLYNPQGDLVFRDTQCDYSLDIVTVEDLGIWKCFAGYDHSMESLEFYAELIEKKIESVQPFIQNTTDYYIIGCQFVGYEFNSLDYCKFTRPDGKIFMVIKGSTTPIYNSFSTDLRNGVCALEILKPLRTEDLGTWKCEGILIGNSGGTFIDVETVKTVKSFSNTGVTSKNVRLGQSFFIDCEVPYSSKKCFIIAPNGTQYKPDNELTVTAGLCLFTVVESTPTDNGEWKCSIAQKNGVPDELITIQVSIIELTVFYRDVEAGENEEVNLVCNTNGVPIDYCRFVSPSGEYYSLDNDASTANGISYVGRGLIYGDCGMKISKVELSQSGQWSCHICPGRNSDAKEDLTKTMELTVKPPRSPISLAESVGIGLGVVVACIAVGGVLFYRNSHRFCARPSAEDTQPTARISNDSTNGESVVLSVGLGTMYNT